MNIIDAAYKRYATKAFDPQKKLSAEHIEQLKQIIRLSPSSINLQAWHFMLASSDEAKAKIAAACPHHFAYNAPKIMQAALVIVFCVKNTIDEQSVREVVEQEAYDGRYLDQKMQQERLTLLTNYVNRINKNPEQATSWLEKQSYLALGNLLLAASALGIDSVPMEGFDKSLLDEILGLNEQGLHSVVIAALGYRSSDDFNAQLPKSRLKTETLFSEIL